MAILRKNRIIPESSGSLSNLQNEVSLITFNGLTQRVRPVIYK